MEKRKFALLFMSEKQTGKAERLYPVRVLIVEDHAELAEATAEFLRVAGLDARIVSDGNSAVEVAEAFRPQIVLCDLRLSDLSGLDVYISSHMGKDATMCLTAASGIDFHGGCAVPFQITKTG